jgi:hypothetical protein
MLGGDNSPHGRVRITPLLLNEPEPALASLRRALGMALHGIGGKARHVPSGEDLVARRTASIEAVPESVLGGFDRAFLLHWARRGYTVYAYKAPAGQWNLWFETWRLELPLPAHLASPAPSGSQ